MSKASDQARIEALGAKLKQLKMQQTRREAQSRTTIILSQSPIRATCLTWGFVAGAGVAIALLVGCVGTQSPSPGRESLTLPVRFLDVNGNDVLVSDRPTRASLLMGAIGGSMSGSPHGSLQADEITDQLTVDLDLRSYAAGMRHAAIPMTASGSADLTATPAEMHFARGSTLLRWKGGGLGNDLRIAFFDMNDTQSILTLAFFDRPCRITGIRSSTALPNKTMEYDVNVAAPGLTWLRTLPTSTNRFLTRVADPSIRPVLVITPIANGKDGAWKIR